MTTERNNLKAGLFIVVSVALIIGVIVGIKGVGTIFTKLQTYTVSFTLANDVGGLAVGDPVRLGGVKVGAVERISFEEPKGFDPRVIVEFTVPRRFELREDAVVAIQGTITGSTWLNVNGLGKGNPVAPGVALVGKPGAMSELLASLRDVGPQLSGVLSDVRTQTLPKVNTAVDGFRDTGPAATSLVKRVESKVDPAVEKYNGLADAGTSALVNIRDIAGDTKGDFRSTMSNLTASTGSLKEKLPSILDKVDGIATKVAQTIDGALVAMEDLKASLASTKELTGSARGILVRNRGKIDDMIGSLKATGDNLKAASAEIRRSPWRLLYKPGAGEMANLNLYDAARQFADGASDLNDAAVSLRDVLKDPSANPEDVQKLVARLDATFGEFKQVEQKLWTSVKE